MSEFLRLKSRRLINQIFEEGDSVFVFPIKLSFINLSKPEDIQAYSNVLPGIYCGFSVPRRLHKKATSRNLLKRRMREACRDHMTILTNSERFDKSSNALGLMYILVDSEITEYAVLDRSMKKLHKKLIAQLHV